MYGSEQHGEGILHRLKDLLTGPDAEQVRDEYERAGDCPNCSSNDYWKKSSFAGAMHRCLNCRAEGLG